MSRTVRFIIIGLAVLAIIIQFVGPATPEVSNSNPDDMIATESVDNEVAGILRTSCYDCHSMETNFPWYASVAPVSWRVNGHVKHGREELNFSEWSSLSRVRKLRKLKDIAEVMEEGEMPLNDYVLMHSEAELTDEQRQLIVDWANDFAEVVMDRKK